MANKTTEKPKRLSPDASPVLSAHVDERWMAARYTRNPGFDKDPKGLIMGFRQGRFPKSLPASFHRKGTQAAVFSGGWAGIKPQDPAMAGVRVSLAHTLPPLPSSLLLLASPNALSFPFCPARGKHLIRGGFLQGTV